MIKLPTTNGLIDFETSLKSAPKAEGEFNRIVFSAAHVVCNPFDNNEIDWETTLNYRRYLWNLGFGVAEAMDTAQRGMGLTWEQSLELIKLSVKESDGNLIYSGVGTDHLELKKYTLDEIVSAYLYQMDQVQQAGGKVILMASRALALSAQSPEDYLYVYREVLNHADSPVILHWLGEMFDPALVGYWGKEDHYEAMDVCLEVIKENKRHIKGIKLSLLSKEKEIKFRRMLPEEVLMFTGDDFNYPELIAGDEQGFSHALLGIFDAIAPVASYALKQFAEGNTDEYFKYMNPTLPLSRHIFQAPTRFYKTGVVFMAYLNGLQDHFAMIDGQQSARTVYHLSELYQLASKADTFLNPETAEERMKKYLALYGVE